MSKLSDATVGETLERSGPGMKRSIGSIAAGVGAISPLVWVISVSLALMQSFLFAEIAGLFPQESGGTSVFGAIAWSPVLTIGSGLAAGYVLTALFPVDAAINTWSVQAVDLGFLQDGLELRFNATFVTAACLLRPQQRRTICPSIRTH